MEGRCGGAFTVNDFHDPRKAVEGNVVEIVETFVSSLVSTCRFYGDLR